MSKRTELPPWAQWAAGVTVLALAVVAGALSLAVNVHYGLQAGLALAVAYGLSDVAKLSIPVVAQGIGWSPFTRLVAVAAAVVSVWCAANYFADREGQRFLDAAHQAGNIEAVKADAARWRDELAAIGTAGNVEILDKRADQLKQAIADEAADVRCGPDCRELQRERDGVLDELAAARRKAELEAKLGKARERLSGEPPEETSGLAALLATATGADKRRVARYVVTARALAALVMVELFAHLAGAGARLIGRAMTPKARRGAAKAGEPKPSAKAPQPERPAPTPAEVVPISRAERGFRNLAGVQM